MLDKYDIGLVVACIVDCMSWERLEWRKRVELSRTTLHDSEGSSANLLIDIFSHSRCCIGGYYQTHKLSIIILTWFFVILKSAYKLFILISRNLVSRLILHGSINSSLWKGIASLSLYFGSINTSRNPDTSFKCFKLLHTTDLWSLITTFDKNRIS